MSVCLLFCLTATSYVRLSIHLLIHLSTYLYVCRYMSSQPLMNVSVIHARTAQHALTKSTSTDAIARLAMRVATVGNVRVNIPY